MKKVRWIKPVIFTAILILIACRKEDQFSGEIEYTPTHWPAVKTLYVTNLTSTTATLNGTVNGYGLNTTVTFEYSVGTFEDGIQKSLGSTTVTASQSPLADSGNINVSADISGLTPCQVYQFRIKAENSLWKNFYGDQQSFLTNRDSISQPASSPFNPNLTYGTVSDIDGNSYKTIQIGFQVWMAENLRTTRYADGTAIPLVTTGDEWAALTDTDKAYCWYNFNTDCNATFYGAYYTWAAAMNGAASSSSSPSGVQGVCPDGWHIPSNDEWRILAKFPAGILKDTITWYTGDNPATNESGFTALASGKCAYDGSFQDTGVDHNGLYSYMWSSTDSGTEFGHAGAVCQGSLREGSNSFIIVCDQPDEGNSVRCLKDYVPQGQLPTVTTEPATNITSTGATLNGTVNANGSPTIVEFEYPVPYMAKPPRGGWRFRPMRVLATPSTIEGCSPTQVSVAVTLKIPEALRNSGVLRTFRVVATNSAGVVYGEYVTF